MGPLQHPTGPKPIGDRPQKQQCGPRGVARDPQLRSYQPHSPRSGADCCHAAGDISSSASSFCTSANSTFSSASAARRARRPRRPVSAMTSPSVAIPVTTPRPGLYADNIPAGVVTPAELLLITAVTTARTTAPPTWLEVLKSPDASPCSSSETPETAWMFSAGNPIANPMPISTMLGKTVEKYAASGPIRSDKA